MIIYKDILDDGTEFFCNQSFKVEDDGVLLKLHTKNIVKPSDDLSGINIGSNPSQENPDEDAGCGGGADTQERILEIVHYHKLQNNDILQGKKDLKKFLKGYVAAIKNKIKDNTEKYEEFKSTIGGKKGGEAMEFLLNKADDIIYLVGENYEVPELNESKGFDVTHGAGFYIWDDDGMGATVYFLKCGLVEEKV